MDLTISTATVTFTFVCTVLASVSFFLAVARAVLVLLVEMHLEMCSLLLLAGPDAQHHGQYDTETAHHQGHHHPLSRRRAFSHGPGCFADH